MKQLRNGTKGKIPTLKDRQSLVLVLYDKEIRLAAIEHDIWELKQLIRSGYWGVRDLLLIKELLYTPKRKKK